MEVWDEDDETNVDDLIDQFMITIPEITMSAMYGSDPMTIEGEKGIGKVTITYHSFTTDQLVPSCNSTDAHTTTITITPGKNYYTL